jgi:hypothetical protein
MVARIEKEMVIARSFAYRLQHGVTSINIVNHLHCSFPSQAKWINPPAIDNGVLDITHPFHELLGHIRQLQQELPARRGMALHKRAVGIERLSTRPVRLPVFAERVIAGKIYARIARPVTRVNRVIRDPDADPKRPAQAASQICPNGPKAQRCRYYGRTCA